MAECRGTQACVADRVQVDYRPRSLPRRGYKLRPKLAAVRTARTDPGKAPPISVRPARGSIPTTDDSVSPHSDGSLVCKEFPAIPSRLGAFTQQNRFAATISHSVRSRSPISGREPKQWPEFSPKTPVAPPEVGFPAPEHCGRVSDLHAVDRPGSCRGPGCRRSFWRSYRSRIRLGEIRPRLRES